jgi:hypothetical protein
MRKFLLLLTTMTLLIVAAGCGEDGAAPVSNVPTLTSPPTQPVPPTPWSTTAPGTATCRTAPSVVQSLPDLSALLPPATAQDWSIGPAGAPVTLIEYADFQ